MRSSSTGPCRDLTFYGGFCNTLRSNSSILRIMPKYAMQKKFKFICLSRSNVEIVYKLVVYGSSSGSCTLRVCLPNNSKYTFVCLTSSFLQPVYTLAKPWMFLSHRLSVEYKGNSVAENKCGMILLVRRILYYLA